MAVSMDDKILGVKMNYYCSSSEDEAENDSSDECSHECEDNVNSTNRSALPEAPPSLGDNKTGPKGVIADWRRYRQLKTENRKEQEVELQSLTKRLAFTCRTALDEEDEKKLVENEGDDSDVDFLFNDEDDAFMQEYRARRMMELQNDLNTCQNSVRFGDVLELSSDNLVEILDSAPKNIKVIVHIYEKEVQACESMTKCLQCLAKIHSNVKFCQMQASRAHMSHAFSSEGVPALLVYMNGELLGCHVRIRDQLGDDFYVIELQSFLQSYGYLPLTSADMSGILGDVESDGESDFEVD